MGKRPTVCGVQVHTWGTSYGGGRGVWSHLKGLLYGGGIEHAAITLTIPDNDEGRLLVEEYCEGEEGKIIIPYKQKTIKFAGDKSENVLIIYFSSWSAPESFHLNPTVNDDKKFLFAHSDFYVDDKIKDKYSSSQKKIVKGIIGKRTIIPGPAVIAHNVNKNQFDVVSKLSNNVIINFNLASLRKLKNKLEESNSNNPFILSDSNKLLITNMLGDYSYINNELLKNKILTQENVNEILSITNDEVEELEQKLLENKEKINKKFRDEQGVYYIEENNLLYGPLESGLVSLPISNSIADDVGVNNGLDVKAMLQQMKALAVNRVTMELKNNCSEMVAKILEAGVQQRHLKSVLAERAIFKINTPQMLYSAVLRVQQGLAGNEQSNMWHRLQYFNPATPIEKIIQSLIMFILNKNASAIDVAVLFTITVLLIPLLVTKALVWPFNMLGGFMAKEPHVNIVTDKKQFGPLTELEDMDLALKTLIKLRIKQIEMVEPTKTILEFAKILHESESIPVFASKDVDKLKKYIRKHNTTPEDLKDNIVKLKLPLPENLDYSNLGDLVDELQLLSSQRVTVKIEQLYDVIKNRKTTIVTQFEEAVGKSTVDHANDVNKENDTPTMGQNGPGGAV